MAALDFAGMLRLGLVGLGLHPAQFWDLTPSELAVMAGLAGQAGGMMTRDRLEALAKRFPDDAGNAGGEVEREQDGTGG